MDQLFTAFKMIFLEGETATTLMIVGPFLLFIALVVVMSRRAVRYVQKHGQENLERRLWAINGKILAVLALLSIGVWALSIYGNHLATAAK